MHNLLFMPKVWEDIGWWIKNDLKTVKKIYSLLENCCQTPFTGTGQPEPLKANYSGYRSKRINLEHRIIYKVEANNIIIHSLH
ncbi:Txe/YoeB family addiction module toxin [Ilyomonas limi]|uniref:Putative mRNA interferase YoeB n=2 Tax=Ilyomonas limi TaxID=2575867 RepID=A0A4U3L8V4_9BACT|nr:Txe/YoeB family addiction module toxin [Ilyomonas limi]